MNPRGSRSRPGFTLVELIVAGVITGLVAAAATLSVSHTLRARDSASARHAAFRRAAVAADRVSGDVRALLRDPDPLGVRFVLTDSGSADEAADQILLYARTLRRARAALPTEAESEGDAYEVQYRLGPAPPPPGAGAISRAPLAALWRRADPVPDENELGGGVASALVAGVAALSIEASDGVGWFPAWDSDISGLPHLVRITVRGRDDSGRYTHTARRTVALDRVPVEPEEPVEEEEQDPEQPTGSEPSAPAPAEADQPALAPSTTRRFEVPAVPPARGPDAEPAPGQPPREGPAPQPRGAPR